MRQQIKKSEANQKEVIMTMTIAEIEKEYGKLNKEALANHVEHLKSAIVDLSVRHINGSGIGTLLESAEHVLSEIKKHKYTFYEDPKHGWLKVSISELKQLDILDKISHYSFMKANHAYLEEDCDLSIFLNAKFKDSASRKTFLDKVPVMFKNYDSPIRYYKRMNYEEKESC